MMINVVAAGRDLAAHMRTRAPAIYQTVSPQFHIGWRLWLWARPCRDQPAGYHAGKFPLNSRRRGRAGWVVQNINQSDPRIEFQLVRRKWFRLKRNNFWIALDQGIKLSLGVVYSAQRCAIICARCDRKSI